MPAPTATAEAPDTATETFAVMFRPSAGGRWKRIGRATGYREALALVIAAGDFWLKRIDQQDAAGPTLFDPEET